jgi:para-nitrobenzyl esterase
MISSPPYGRRRIALALTAGAFSFATLVAGPAAATSMGAGANAPSASSTLVRTLSGPVTGFVSGNMLEYLGIPYAAPPVGALRWKPPAPAASWSSPLAATHFGPHCPQAPSPFGQPSITEACLYLNVFTPASGSVFGQRRPVMVWIHGGAFVVGESDDYNPAKLIARGVDVVTLNYRLGALGFLALPSLDSEGHLFANYGLLDQQAALQWVRHNIAAFGGDPNRVTVFGESAGGASVMSQLASPLATGTFQRAIIESGAYADTPSLADAESSGTSYATAEGCTSGTAACMRALSVTALLTDEPTGYVPTVDGTILPQNPKVAIANGAFNRVPVINGSNGEEFRLFTALDFDFVTGPITPATYPLAIAAEVGPVAAPLVIAQYPLSAYPTPDLANSAALTDGTFSCNALFLDQSLAHYVPTFSYEFSDINAPELFLPPVAFPYEAAHASEIQYLFTVAASFPHPLSAQQMRLSDAMVNYWTNFATLGNPLVGGGNLWFPFVPQAGNMVNLNTPRVSNFTGFNVEHQCAFWNLLLMPPSPTAKQDLRHPMVRGR